MRTGWLALALGMATYGSALALDRSAPIELQADKSEYDGVSQVGKFFGNVQITQGPLRIEADEAWFYQEGEETRLIRLKGGPVTFAQKGPTPDEQFDGKSREVEYYVLDGTVLFIKDVELTRTDMQIKSERVRYDLNANQVLAGQSAGDDDSRVRVKLNGAKEPEKPAPPPEG